MVLSERSGPLSMDIREIVAIDAVAHARSFKLAAEGLFTSQPTLSRLIASAEEKLGCALFSRGWSGAETTARGDIVATICASIVSAIDRTQAALFPDRANVPSLWINLKDPQLEAIAAVYSEGSVTLAARKLGRPQPDISRSLSDLSKRFGLSLFTRSASGMVPLEPAQLLVDLSGTIAYHLNQIEQQLQRLEGDIVGRVSIGMLPFSGQDLILRTFAALTNQYPNIRLACVPGSYNSLVEALRRREIDRIIGVMRADACPAGLTEEHLYDERFAVIARRDHPLNGRGHDLDALMRTKWVVAPFGTPVRSYFEAVFLQLNATPPTQTCELLSFGSAEQMLLNSHSVAMLTYSPRKLAELHMDLAEIETGFPSCAAPIGLSRLQEVAIDPALAEFDRLLKEQIQTIEAGPAGG